MHFAGVSSERLLHLETGVQSLGLPDRGVGHLIWDTETALLSWFFFGKASFSPGLLGWRGQAPYMLQHRTLRRPKKKQSHQAYYKTTSPSLTLSATAPWGCIPPNLQAQL